MKTYQSILLSLGILFSNQNIFAQKDKSVIDKAGVNLMVTKGIDLYGLGRLNDAISIFKSAELKDTANWKIQYWMGKCFYDMTMYLSAEECANRSLDLISRMNDTEASINELLGNVNHRLGNIDLALV